MIGDPQVKVRLTPVLMQFANSKSKSALFKRTLASLLYLHKIEGRYKNPRFLVQEGKDRKVIQQMLSHAEKIIEVLENAPMSSLELLPSYKTVLTAAETICDQGDGALTALKTRKALSPYKRYAQEVELEAYQFYEQCHGKRSATLRTGLAKVTSHQFGNKTYGPYLDFVTNVYQAMGVDASAEGVIRTRQRKKKENSSTA